VAQRLTVEEAAATYAAAMRNVLPLGPGACEICHTFIDPECYTRCLRCARDVQYLDAVVPITYSLHYEQMHTVLRGYKDGPLRDQTFMMARLAAILWRFLELHESCVAGAAGVEGFDVVATVPSSTSQRDQVSNLRTLAGWCAPISDRLERLLEPTGDVVGRSFSTSRYRAVRPLVGERVLLLDDTWTAGGHAQSAGFTLKDNGGRAVALVAIGRHLQPAWTPAVPDGPTCAELWEGLPRVFDWGACAVHGR
jgi:predicted amidophosphoribosyltransferase